MCSEEVAVRLKSGWEALGRRGKGHISSRRRRHPHRLEADGLAAPRLGPFPS